MKSNKTLFLALTFFLALATGCSHTTRTERAFGDAVRQVTSAQVYDSNAAAHPDPAAVLGGDPERLNNTLEGHRKDVASPQDTKAPVTVNIGN